MAYIVGAFYKHLSKEGRNVGSNPILYTPNALSTPKRSTPQVCKLTYSVPQTSLIR